MRRLVFALALALLAVSAGAYANLVQFGSTNPPPAVPTVVWLDAGSQQNVLSTRTIWIDNGAHHE